MFHLVFYLVSFNFIMVLCTPTMLNNTDRDIALCNEGCLNKWSLLEITEFIQVLFLIKFKQQMLDRLF